MPRDLHNLTSRRHDLLVIGGGIHGLFAAYDAAQRGLAVALVERGDFGGGLSFNHQRTIHGGLRAVAAGRLAKARRQKHERQTWARIAPHFLRPLPFLVGTYRRSRRSRGALRIGLAAYELAGVSRQTGVPASLRLPGGKLVSEHLTRDLFPGVHEAGLTGGAIWYDYQTVHPDRLNWTVALAARAAGAVLLNHVDALAPCTQQGRLAGARVRDALTGTEHDVSARAVLVAAGSRVGPVLEAFGARGAPPLVQAVNVLLDRPAGDVALAAPARSGQMLTAVPWHGYVLAGTHVSSTAVIDPDAPAGASLDEILSDINSAFPALQATRGDVRLVQRGLTPAAVRGRRVALLPEPLVLRHRERGAQGLVSLVGVKFTTARLAAERAVDAICRLLGRTVAGRTAATVLPHAGLTDLEGHMIRRLRPVDLALDPDVMDHLTGWYGTEAPAVVRFSSDRGLLDRLVWDSPVLAGEIAYAVERAQAVHRSEAVLRRTPLGSIGHPGRDGLLRAATLMGDLLGWTSAQRESEVAAVDARFAAGVL